MRGSLLLNDKTCHLLFVVAFSLYAGLAKKYAYSRSSLEYIYLKPYFDLHKTLWNA